MTSESLKIALMFFLFLALYAAIDLPGRKLFRRSHRHLSALGRVHVHHHKLRSTFPETAHARATHAPALARVRQNPFDRFTYPPASGES